MSGEIVERRCAKCGSLYRVERFHSPMRDKDEIECEVCGGVLIKWNGGVFYGPAILVERGEAAPAESKTSG